MVLNELCSKAKGRLPLEYLEYLKCSDGGQGTIPIRPHDVFLFDAKRVVMDLIGQASNRIEGILRIGKHGTCGFIVLDLRRNVPCVSSIPVDSSNYQDLYLIAEDFSQFLSLFEQPAPYVVHNEDTINRASMLLNCQLWPPDTIGFQRKLYNIDKYAPQFEAIGSANKSVFLGLKKDQGSLWQVSLSNVPSPKLIANSIQEATDLVASFSDWWKKEQHRYYEIKNHNSSLDLFNEAWSLLKPWLDQFEMDLRKRSDANTYAKRSGEYDLDESPTIIPTDDLIFWKIPDLTFARLKVRVKNPSQWDTGKLVETATPEYEEFTKLPQFSYVMENALIGFHSANANLAFLTMGTSTLAEFYLGISLPDECPKSSSAKRKSYSALHSLISSVYQDQIEVSEAIEAAEIQRLLTPVCRYTGLLSGFPRIRDSNSSAQLQRIRSGVAGHQFGVLTLAVPIPDAVVLQESAQLEQLKHKSKKEKESAELKQRECQLSRDIGMWLTSTYFFAADRSVFARLRSLLRATYTDEIVRPTRLQIREADALRPLIETFGLLRYKETESTLAIWNHKFLSPLSSRSLSAYVHLPSDKNE